MSEATAGVGSAARAPWIVAAATAALFVASIPLSFVARVNSLGDLQFLIPLVPAVALYLWIGATIASRTRNPIGWIFIAVIAFFSIGSLAGYYATLALVRHPGSLPFGTTAAWIDRWAFTGVLTPFILVFLLFPTGDTPTRRWRWLLWTILALIALEMIGLSLTPGRLTGQFADLVSVRAVNPLGLPVARRAMDAITFVIGMALFLSGLLSVAALIVRYRRAAQEERQQIRWLAYVAVATTVTILAGFATDPGNRDSGFLVIVNNVLFLSTFVLLVLGIPVACGIAILKYRLYDLDVVVRKSIVFAALAVFIAAVYVAIVGGIGALIGATSNTTLSFVAAAVLALLFQPARERARRIADRVVYGRRATPYEVLSEFSERMGETYATDDILPRMAAIVGGGTGATSSAIMLDVGGDLREVARWSADGAGPEGDEHEFEVRHQGELLGAIAVATPPSDPMNPAKDKLVRDLAAQAGLVLRNVRLIEDLRASRQRLVAAQDEERRKLERNLHDGAQQQLVALAVQLRLAEQVAGRDADKEREILHRLQAMATDALEELRDLARGIFPPLLADQGLAAALGAQARKSPIPVTIDADGVGRYRQEVESALYFCTLEALNNVAKYAKATAATIRLVRDDGTVRVEIADDGIGFDPVSARDGTGLRGMSDRLDAVGGRLEIRSSPGHGTTVVAAVSVGQDDASGEPADSEPIAASQADSSRSGPNTALGM
jgi:signal transduction histidine kinase